MRGKIWMYLRGMRTHVLCVRNIHLRRTTIYVSEGELIRDSTNQAVETEICFHYFESPRRGSQQSVTAERSTEKKWEEDVSLKCYSQFNVFTSGCTLSLSGYMYSYTMFSKSSLEFKTAELVSEWKCKSMYSCKRRSAYNYSVNNWVWGNWQFFFFSLRKKEENQNACCSLELYILEIIFTLHDGAQVSLKKDWAS